MSKIVITLYTYEGEKRLQEGGKKNDFTHSDNTGIRMLSYNSLKSPKTFYLLLSIKNFVSMFHLKS